MLDRLVSKKLQAEAEAIATEGWKWTEVSLDLPYGYSHGLRRFSGDPAPMTDEEGAAHAKLLAEYRALEEEYEGQGVSESVSNSDLADDVDLPSFLTADLPSNGASMMVRKITTPQPWSN